MPRPPGIDGDPARTIEGRQLGVPGCGHGSSPKQKQAVCAMFTKRTIRGGRREVALLRPLSGFRPRARGAGLRDLTVMFTDIAGFTRLAETLDPTAVARLLNRHFRSLVGCVEREGGQVDKLVGDGLIAFWGSPTAEPACSAPAVRAALRIRAAIEADNAVRTAHGERPIRLRIGLHVGPVVMARFGAAGRLGVALCGDPVNVAQRLEDAARHVAGGGEVTIVASDAVVARAGSGFGFEHLGELPIRGRSEAVRAFHLRDRHESR
ncbi:MAG TPA: adenylate/guanylate cyclase domain-containing protein [Geminicoccaceae bacterium]|nr:adenylate/guanylate cyclase domain-containing protein [Geminicoccaceae bacterium]